MSEDLVPVPIKQPGELHFAGEEGCFWLLLQHSSARGWGGGLEGAEFTGVPVWAGF